MLNTIDMEQFERVVQEVKDQAEGFLYTGTSTRRTHCTCSRTARPSEIIRDGLESGDRVNTQWSFTEAVGTVARSEESESFWLGSDVIGRHLGSGCYADVYQSKWNPDLVIKIGCGDSKNGDIFGDGWLDYAHYCLVTGPGLILPGIESVQILPEDGVYVALLHKYECTLDDVTRTLSVKDHIWLAEHKAKAVKRGLNCSWIEKEYEQIHPLYFNAAVKLHHGLTRIGVRGYDLHGGNFMLTKHGRVVLTDPTSQTCSEKTKDFLSSLLKEAA